MLTGVDSIEFRFLGYGEEDELEQFESWSEQTGLPAGIEVMVIMEDQREYRRLFTIAGNS